MEYRTKNSDDFISELVPVVLKGKDRSEEVENEDGWGVRWEKFFLFAFDIFIEKFPHSSHTSATNVIMLCTRDDPTKRTRC